MGPLRDPIHLAHGAAASGQLTYRFIFSDEMVWKKRFTKNPGTDRVAPASKTMCGDLQSTRPSAMGARLMKPSRVDETGLNGDTLMGRAKSNRGVTTV